ncbi:diguanylate cyclase [Novosphingobium sp. YJ-S2-02]|uniref:diguanylate cyclase n=1 Tax=Novosphingobium aureum TaxID=2792964 RepID=A0A931MLK2_9SPHN|nr:sensor domain-containing diguanylate cyclase [Novosphingobium aureum]MBH0114142.1 diguanylate cyclase [Novosphingobium aureum]
MRSRLRTDYTPAVWSILAGVVYFTLAILALLLTEGVDGTASVWPSSGVAIAALLLAQRRQRLWLLAIIALASLGANLFSGMTPGLSVAFTAANVIEAFIGYIAIRHINRRGETIYNLHSVIEFCFAAILTASASGVLAVLLSGSAPGLMLVSWITTVALGIMIVVPLVLNLANGLHAIPDVPLSTWAKSLAVLAIVGLVAYVSFHQTAFPLLFLPLLAVTTATYLLGPNGASCSILMIAAIGSAETIAGHGPIHLMRVNSAEAHVLMLQTYLFALLLAALPLAALLNTRDRSLAHISRSKRWLEMAESFAHVGHWRLDLLLQEVFWSDEVFRIHGLEVGDNVALANAVDFYHPEDRARVNECLARAISQIEPFRLEARIIRRDGEVRYVASRGEIEFGADGKPLAIFGIFQDITERTLATMKLANARELAEQQADLAMILAQTDPLTGIANRRSTLAVLDEAVKSACDNGTPLSVAILDIDHFKSINDRFGHGVGDEVIKTVARKCTAFIRTSDSAGRIGGEEFVLVLPGAGPDIAEVVGERVRQSIEEHCWGDQGPQQVTASIGLATFRAGMSAEVLLEQADKALYRAKSDGRNLLRIAA